MDFAPMDALFVKDALHGGRKAAVFIWTIGTPGRFRLFLERVFPAALRGMIPESKVCATSPVRIAHPARGPQDALNSNAVQDYLPGSLHATNPAGTCCNSGGNNIL